jgi:signal transduction histidine kinase
VNRAPSIRARLANALVLWSVLWSLAVGAAVWLAARHEVLELLDDTLRASAHVLRGLLVTAPAGAAPLAVRSDGAEYFAWQVVDARGAVLQHSTLAPAEPLRATPAAGFSDAPDWRIFGLAVDADGRMLYVAQTRDERLEAQVDVAFSSVLAALAIGLLGHFWLRQLLARELRPLQNLSERLAAHPLGDEPAALGVPQRAELAPMHEAIEQLAQRLARRIADERAFAGHVAHALRTPLAGIDAQLAVAQRESPPALQPRLARTREATARLSHVITALLGLFRSGGEPQVSRVDLGGLLARLPVERVRVQVAEGVQVDADADLLAAALLNLLDNAQRHGASSVTVDVPASGVVRLRDDGPGVSAARRAELEAALRTQAYEGHTGLGLMLADRVARAHGGGLCLPATQGGFAVELHLPGVLSQAPVAPLPATLSGP